MLVEVHPRVQTAGLLVLSPVVTTGLQGVQRSGAVSEEPERVEVGAGNPVALNDLVGATCAQPQRPVVAERARRLMDHRPLMQPEAAERRWSARGRCQQSVDGVDEGEQRLEVWFRDAR